MVNRKRFKRLLMILAAIPILGLAYAATTSGDTGGPTSPATAAGGIAEGSGPLFLAMRRAQTTDDASFPSDAAATQAIAQGQLVKVSARRVLGGADGSSGWLIPSASGDLCFVSIDASGVTTTVCVPEAWAATHGGLGVTASTETGKASPSSTAIQGVLPDGAHGANITNRDGASIPVPLNADNAYSVVIPGVPLQITYVDQAGTEQHQSYPASAAQGNN